MAAKAKKEEKTGLTYKGKPLQRCGNQLYYGNVDDKYILLLTVEDSETEEGLEISKAVKVELQDNTGKTKKTIRKAERENLYEALDLGEYWLTEALEIG